MTLNLSLDLFLLYQAEAELDPVQTVLWPAVF